MTKRSSYDMRQALEAALQIIANIKAGGIAMSDIVICGIDMPKSGYVEMLLKVADVEVYYNHVGEREIKPTDYITLPKGHGRLGDLDAIAEDLQFDIENDQRALDNLNIAGKERERIQLDRDCKQYCMRYLSNCHAIIPAEGGETDADS